MEVVYQPHRLKLKGHHRMLSYAGPKPGNCPGLPLKPVSSNIISAVPGRGEVLGWLDHNGLDNLQLLDEHGN